MTDVAPPGAPHIDLLDPEFYRPGPHDAYRWMRAHEPVYRDGKNKLWAITRHADVADVEKRSSVFVSGQAYRSWGTPDENNMIALDDPDHLRQRRLVSARFSPRAVRSHEEWLRTTIAEILDEWAERSESEVIVELAAQLPCRLTAKLLGFPEERWSDVKGWSERLMRIDTCLAQPEQAVEMGQTIQEFGTLLGELIPERRACPADDLVSVWANANIDGFRYDFMRMIHETGLFIAGGAETTRTVIAHGLRTFCDHPDAWELLAAEPDRVPTAVEELLRWVTPLNNFFRTAIDDTTIADQPIRAGDRIILLYPSANRDESVFTDPDTFDITRSPNPHLAFGHGTHFCLGANLARLELSVLLGELTRRFTNLRVVEEPDVEPNIFARSVRSFRLGYDLR